LTYLGDFTIIQFKSFFGDKLFLSEATMWNDFKAIFKHEFKQFMCKRNIIILLILLVLWLIFVHLEINRYKRQMELEKTYYETMGKKPI
jgi:hypothetical protein